MQQNSELAYLNYVTLEVPCKFSPYRFCSANDGNHLRQCNYFYHHYHVYIYIANEAVLKLCRQHIYVRQ